MSLAHSDAARVLVADGLSATEMLERYATRALSPCEVLSDVAREIEMTAALGAFFSTCLDRAHDEAVVSERRFASGRARRLEGIPIAVKDNFDTAHVETTYGSPMLRGRVPRRDAVAVQRLRQEGAILVGKTQMHEFAWGVTSVNPAMGSARNPWAPARIAGGSSGGSAVAVATGIVPLALGTDTGGSIRVPAALCGVFGLKPTWGAVSTVGTMPLARSLDHVGPMARTPADARLALSVLAGGSRAAGTREPGDITTGDARSRIRVGVCPDLELVHPQPRVAAVLSAIEEALAGWGATVVELPFPDARSIPDIFTTIQRYEAVQAHRRAGLYPARRSEYGDDVRSRLDAADSIATSDYRAAQSARRHISARFADAFKHVDVLLTPAVPIQAPRPGENTIGDADTRALLMSCTVAQNLAGLPACVMRAGFDTDGLPVGIQLSANRDRDDHLLAVGERLYAATAEIQSSRPPAAPGRQRTQRAMP